MIYIMGGGGLSKCSIIVHIDTGSMVGAYTDSSHTTLVKAGKEIGSSGDYVITGLAAGTYYVLATKNGKSATKTVTFSADGIKDAALAYQLVVYDYGNQDTAATGGLQSVDGWGQDFTFNDYNLGIYISQNQNGRTTAYRTANLVDMSLFSRLKVRSKVTTAEKAISFEVSVKSASLEKKASYYTNALASEETRSIDISSVNEPCYIEIMASVYSGDYNPAVIAATVYSIIAE